MVFLTPCPCLKGNVILCDFVNIQEGIQESTDSSRNSSVVSVGSENVNCDIL